MNLYELFLVVLGVTYIGAVIYGIFKALKGELSHLLLIIPLIGPLVLYWLNLTTRPEYKYLLIGELANSLVFLLLLLLRI